MNRETAMGNRVWFGALLLWGGWLLSPVCAEVSRVQIDRREPFAEGRSFGAVGPYEVLSGRVYLTADPRAAHNAEITDLALAPCNREGLVDYWTDFVLLKPLDVSRGNRRLLYDVNNRGNPLALGSFNQGGGTNRIAQARPGNGFLMRQGYSVLWSGWNGDVIPGDHRLQIGLPIATGKGGPVTGRTHCEICVETRVDSQPLNWGNSRSAPPVQRGAPDGVLTVRDQRGSAPREVPRTAWRLGRSIGDRLVGDDRYLSVDGGLEPGKIYELVYEARDPRVTGLGLAGVRDLVSFLRHDRGEHFARPNPLAGQIDRAYGFGVSQSGRFLNHFVWQGFNLDPAGGPVFDGLILHVSGAGRGWFNHRFAQTTRHASPHEDLLSPSEEFPFTTTPSRDPVTGAEGDVLARARQAGVVPRMFYVLTSTEYWCRAASLLHTDVTGEHDAPVDPSARVYFVCGAQHGVPGHLERGNLAHPPSPLDPRGFLRALLVDLDAWVTRNEPPPDSRIPRLAEGTLWTIAEWQRRFPAGTSLRLPTGPLTPLRLDWGPRWSTDRIADVVPPRVTGTFTTLVPAVDGDGNEVGGIRLPEVAVPLGIYAGWNLRRAETGGAQVLSRLTGSSAPLAWSPETRASQDHRPAVRQRYGSRDDFVNRRVVVAQELVAQRLWLPEELDPARSAAGDAWDSAADR
jgi:hypothetical protein